MAKARRLDAQAIKTILSVLRRGRGLTTAARLAQVSRQAVYKKMLSSKRFHEQVEEAKACADESVAGSLWDNATGQPVPAGHRPPNVAAGMYWTKNRDPKNWRDKRDVEPSENSRSPN